MAEFRFPKKIVYLGRLMTGVKVVKKDDVRVAIYKDDELDIERNFTENLFKYFERYGSIERRR